jgi:hypothetical protein
MALKQQTVEIDGHKYNITQLGALEGRRLVVRLSKALAPMLGSFADHEKLTEGAVSVALPIRVIPTLSAVESRNSAPDLAQGS